LQKQITFLFAAKGSLGIYKSDTTKIKICILNPTIEIDKRKV